MIGQTLGPYRIVKLLGEGGFGAVYLGEHQAIGRRVAIKVLLPQVSAHPEMVQRFFNEARVKARVDHPGLVDVFDFGQMADGAAYLVMEFLAGQSLADKIQEAGRVSLPEILTIARQTAAALGAAHGQQVIHRDLKPDNLFLTRDDELAFGIRVKVLDFGIAKLAGDPQSGVRTQTSAIFGTPAYMSPEQCRGAALVDARSDIYSLGCILFEMATGQRPFQGEMAELLVAHLRDEPPRPSSIVPDIAPALEQLIGKSLAKDPAARQQTMAELIAEFDAIGRSPRRSSASCRRCRARRCGLRRGRDERRRRGRPGRIDVGILGRASRCRAAPQDPPSSPTSFASRPTLRCGTGR